MTKIFFDTEFTGLRQSTTLISIGLVSDCGKSFYAEVPDYDKSQVTRWIQENVIDKLTLNDWLIGIDEKDGHTKVKCGHYDLRYYLGEWLKQFERVEMWSDVLSYDWVLLCNIFGWAPNLPENICYIPFDIATLFKLKDIDPDINREKFAFDFMYEDVASQKHNALYDANVIRLCYEKLMI